MILTQYLLDIIFPPVCLACKELLKDRNNECRRVCANCAKKLDFMPGFLCPVCFRRLPDGKKVCHWDSQFVLAAPLQYSNPAVRELIFALKYGGLRAAADPLASVFAEYLTESVKNSLLDMSDFIFVPIPLHPVKERKRGFNQALVIAQKTMEKTDVLKNIPIADGALVRTRPTLSQTGQKDRAAREENVRGCFEIRKPELVSGKNVFLMDDVFTSGATMNEAARVLKLAGAKKIIALAAARA